MVARVYLSAEDKDRVSILREAMGAPNDQWVAARIALARSLQLAEPAEKGDYKPIAKQADGVELHARQLIGEGKDGRHDDGDDLSDAFRVLLSVYEGRDLFLDDQAFHEALQRHVRRGLKVVCEEWHALGDLPNYLATEVLHGSGDPSIELAATPDAGLSDRVMRVLGELGVGATLNEVGNGPRLTQLTLELHDYDDLDRLRRSAEKIGFALGLGEEAVGVTLASGEKLVHLTLPRASSTWRSVSWSDMREELRTAAARAMKLPICIGTDIMGSPFLLDLAEAPHLLVGGTTGSGKSMCLHALLLSILEGPGGRTDLVLIDPKEVEFSAYEKCAWLRTEVVRAADLAEVVLEDLVAEMDRRQESFRELGVRDFAEARDKGADINRVVVVIDELGDLLLQRREIETYLIRLAQKARSSGIHLVLATQRPEAATFSGMLRSNVPSRIALTVQKASESRIILDEGGAESLLMRGDMLVKMSGDTIRRAHGCRVELADILAGIALT